MAAKCSLCDYENKECDKFCQYCGAAIEVTEMTKEQAVREASGDKKNICNDDEISIGKYS